MQITSHGDSKTPRQVTEILGVSRSTLYRWETNCGPLENAPLLPDHDPITGAKRYSNSLIKQIQKAFSAAKKGRFQDKNGIAWVSQDKARRILAAYWHRKDQRKGNGPTDRTFSDWHINGCIHLANCERLVPRLMRLDQDTNVPRAWYREQKILEIKKSLIFIHRHGHPDDSDLFTAYGIAKNLKIAPKRVYDWEDAERIEPVAKAGKWGMGGSKNQTKYYSLSAARDLLNEETFDGIYHEPNGNRYNANAAAKALGHKWPNQVRKLMRGGALQPENRIRTIGQKISEKTISERILLPYKKTRDKARRTKRPKGWVRSEPFVRFLQRNGCADRDAAREMEKLFRANRRYADRFANSRKDQIQLVWYYDIDGIAAELAAGRSLSDIAALLQIARADDLSRNGHSAPAQSGERVSAKSGPDPDPAVEAMSKCCYDEYVTNRRSRKETWKIVKDRFPTETPSNSDDIKVYARRYARRHNKPWR